METLRDLPSRKANAAVQDDSEASRAPKIGASDGFLSLTESADAIFHRWQALGDSVGVSVQFRGKTVKLSTVLRPSVEDLTFGRSPFKSYPFEPLTTHVKMTVEQQAPMEAGEFFLDKKRQALWLRCGSSTPSWLLVTQLQQADRKVGSALDFANGSRLKAGQRECFSPVDVAPAA